jgi:hypothetical protein
MSIIMPPCFLSGILPRKYLSFISNKNILLSIVFRRYAPGGDAVVPVIVNACVHVVMYLYYALSAMHIQRKRLAQVKLFVTIIQVKIEFFSYSKQKSFLCFRLVNSLLQLLDVCYFSIRCYTKMINHVMIFLLYLF